MISEAGSDTAEQLGNERVLVTGGAGFIGSHLVEAIAPSGAQIRVLDNLDDFYPGKGKNTEALQRYPNVRIIRGTILDQALLKRLCRWATLVFHEAGQAGIRYCNERPMKAQRINTEGTLKLLVASRDHPPRRIVNASSSSVYGSVDHLPISEDAPKRPNSVYAASKLAAEQYCEAFHRAYSLDIVTLRYFSVYGPRQRPDLVIASFTEKLYRGERPVIYGDGTHSRDFTYVTDIVDGTIRAALANGVAGMTFNLGRGDKTTVRELFRILADLLEAKDLEPIFRPEFPGEFPHTQADISLARKHLGYDPRVSLREGLRRYVDWFLSKNGEGRRVTI